MNTLGKTVPSLIDPRLVKELLRMPQVMENIPEYKLLYIDKMTIYNFIRNYGIFIVGSLIIAIYIWKRYIWYQSIKGINIIKPNIEYESIITPNFYIPDNSIQVLQRPIPEYKTNSINQEVRNLYLDKLERKEIRPRQSLPMRVSSRRGNCEVGQDRLDNIYNQPVYQYDNNQWSASIDRGCPGPLGRNAPIRADVPDCDNFYEFYDTDNNM